LETNYADGLSTALDLKCVCKLYYFRM